MTPNMTKLEFNSIEEKQLGKWVTNAYILFMSGLWPAFIVAGSPVILPGATPTFFLVLVCIFIVLAVLAAVYLNIFLVRLFKFSEPGKVYQELANSFSPLEKIAWGAGGLLAAPWFLIILVWGVDPGWFGLILLLIHIASSVILFKAFRGRNS